MLDKLNKIEARYQQISDLLSEPDTIKDIERWKSLMKEQSGLAEIVNEYRHLKGIQSDKEDYLHMLETETSEMREMIELELESLNRQYEESFSSLKVLMLPKDPNDNRNVILEIRAGTGGDEAALFGADLLRMYIRYTERNGLKAEIISSNATDMGGIKEAILGISGKAGVYSRLKFESGVHRVQRVPETESQGKIQTSAATVAVLPEVDDVQVEIRDTDIRIDTYRSSGAGGQHVNKTESAIRIIHLPTGIVVQCQDEKSQLKNKEQAMRVLKSRVYNYYESLQRNSIASERKSLVGSGDRSERIRTYNFPQGRVTDHRIGLTLYKLNDFLDGDMNELIDALVLSERTKALESWSNDYDN